MQFCDKGHQLFWSTNEQGYQHGQFICYACSKSYLCAMGRWSCLPCKYNICPPCAVPAPGSDPTQSCKKGHPVSWSTSLYGISKQKYSCDVCGKNDSSAAGRYCCQPCTYDVCPRCRPKNSGPKSSIGPGAKTALPFTYCEAGHLYLWSTETSNCQDGLYLCRNCHLSKVALSGRYACAACKSDICAECKHLGPMPKAITIEPRTHQPVEEGVPVESPPAEPAASVNTPCPFPISGTVGFTSCIGGHEADSRRFDDYLACEKDTIILSCAIYRSVNG